jgi:hypothetical protein
VAAKAADLILIPYRPAAFDLAAIGTALNLASMADRSRQRQKHHLVLPFLKLARSPDHHEAVNRCVR